MLKVIALLAHKPGMSREALIRHYGLVLGATDTPGFVAATSESVVQEGLDHLALGHLAHGRHRGDGAASAHHAARRGRR